MFRSITLFLQQGNHTGTTIFSLVLRLDRTQDQMGKEIRGSTIGNGMDLAEWVDG